MRLRLWHRLFLLIAATGITGMAAALLAQQWQFERGFLRYLNELNLEQQQPGVARLAAYYRAQGGWQGLRDSRRRFDAVVSGRTLSAEEERGPPGIPLPPPSPRMDDRPPPDGLGRPPRPRADFKPGGPSVQPLTPPAAPPPVPPAPPPDGGNRLVLTDAAGARVAGGRDLPADAAALPIVVDGAIVGHLLVAPLPALRRGVDIAFAHAQARNALVIGAGVVLLALLAAWLLARNLLAPIVSLGAGARSLARGDYAVRIPAARGDELGDLARDFKALAAVLHDNRMARRRWGADIAHELRTPLAILSGELQAMHDGIRPLTREALDSLRGECQRLTDLVEDLFQLSLADAGALEYRRQETDLAAVIRSAADLHRHALEEHGLALELALTPAAGLWVMGDERRLTQLFANLFTNACRYTDAPGRVRISGARENACWRIAFEDTAPGVPAAHLPRLFERLYRVEASRNRESGGAGLGLSIVESIVTAHGGAVEASASTLGGLAVLLRIPVDEAAVHRYRDAVEIA